MIETNLQHIQASIRATAEQCGRNAEGIILVGVTKFAGVPAVNAAVQAGLAHIAENRVQLADAKFPQLHLAGRAVTKHLIGHLQTNKAKDAVRLFDLIQSVDSPSLAAEINKRAAAQAKVQDILIQLDIAGEVQKFGLARQDLAAMLEALRGLPNVRLQGLMTMAPLTGDKEKVRSVFRVCREHYEKLSRSRLPDNAQMKYLSMGMSGDYVTAIEEGANMLRIGSAIFAEV